MNYDTTLTNEVSTRSTSAILMFSAGALLGIAAALVLAPASGRETRRYLWKRGRAMAETVAVEGRKVVDEQSGRVAEAVRQGFAYATGANAGRPNGSEAGQGM